MRSPPRAARWRAHPRARPGGGLHEKRQPELANRGVEVARRRVADLARRQQRDAAALRDALGLELRAHCCDRARRRTDEAEPRLLAQRREARVLGEEAVAGVHRVGAGGTRRGHDRVAAQVRLTRRRAAERNRLIRLVHERLVPIGVGEHGDGRDTHGTAGTHHAARDLAAVGDEQLADRLRLGCSHRRGDRHMRKTPKPRAPRTSAE